MTRLIGYTLTAAWTAAGVTAVGTGRLELTFGLLLAGAVTLVLWHSFAPAPEVQLGEHDGWEGRDTELATVTAPLPDHPVCLGCLTRPACRPEMACRSCQRSYMAARRQLQRRRRPAAIGGAR